MRSWIQAIIAVAGIADIVGSFWLEQALTLRAIMKPVDIFTVPYETHGGTVYVSPFEMSLIVGSWIMAATLVGIQLLLNTKKRVR